MVVGASSRDVPIANIGVAYVFVRDESGNWHERAKLIASDAAELDIFGYPVEMSGNTVVMGAWGNDSVDTDSGAAYVFDLPEPHALYVWRDPDSPPYDPAVHGRYVVNYNNLVEPEARFDAVRLDVEASSFPGEVVAWGGAQADEAR